MFVIIYKSFFNRKKDWILWRSWTRCINRINALLLLHLFWIWLKMFSINVSINKFDPKISKSNFVYNILTLWEFRVSSNERERFFELFYFILLLFFFFFYPMAGICKFGEKFLSIFNVWHQRFVFTLSSEFSIVSRRHVKWKSWKRGRKEQKFLPSGNFHIRVFHQLANRLWFSSMFPSLFHITQFHSLEETKCGENFFSFFFFFF